MRGGTVPESVRPIPGAFLGLAGALTALYVFVRIGSVLAARNGDGSGNATASSAIVSSAVPDSLLGDLYIVPSDLQARYYLIRRTGTREARVLFTRRVGSSGTTYSKRQFNCSNRTFKYLGTGDTPALVEQSSPDATMSAILEGTIAGATWHVACGK